MGAGGHGAARIQGGFLGCLLGTGNSFFQPFWSLEPCWSPSHRCCPGSQELGPSLVVWSVLRLGREGHREAWAQWGRASQGVLLGLDVSKRSARGS